MEDLDGRRTGKEEGCSEKAVVGCCKPGLPWLHGRASE